MSQEKNNIEIEIEKDNGKTDKNQQVNDSKGTEKTEEKKKRFKKSDILVFVLCIVSAVIIWAYASNLERKAEADKISKEDIPTTEDISEIVGDLSKNEVATNEVTQ